ncbi:MAG: nuclear transport factor 2 family protein [Terriglobia bacterium]|nr:nuclear transport factor 2 family protein [Terriglobia bacterium]
MTKSPRYVATFVILCCVITSTACTKWGEKKNANWHQATSGERLVNLFWNDVQHKKWQELDRHVGPEFLGTNQLLTLDKPALLDHLSHLNVDHFQIGEVQTRPAGNDLLVSYVITLRMKSASGPGPEMRLRMLSVWQELKHGWVVVAMSSSPIQ